MLRAGKSRYSTDQTGTNAAFLFGATIMRILFFILAAAVSTVAVQTSAAAQGAVNVYCSVQVEWCQAIAVNFEKATNVKVNMVQKGSGEMLAQIRAEAANPRGDVWFGGTGDPHLSAAEDNLTQDYDSPEIKNLHPWAQNQWTTAKKRTVGVYLGTLGFGFNKEILAKKISPSRNAGPTRQGDYQARCRWRTRTRRQRLHHVATLVPVMGGAGVRVHEKAAPHINSYTRSGTAPVRRWARADRVSSAHARRGDGSERRFPGRHPCAVRRNRLRDRLDSILKARASRQRPQVL